MSSTTPSKLRSKLAPALGWSAIAALGACAACCALPLLVGAGVGGGLISALIGLGGSRADAVAGAVIGLAGVAALVLRGRARSASQCAMDSGCGCAGTAPTLLWASPKASPDEPVMCTADLRDRPAVRAQLAGYQEAFRFWLRTERTDHGFRWLFEHRPGLEAQLRHLMKNESECCRFFEFELQSAGDELIWLIRGGSAPATLVDEFANLPHRLREHGSDEAGIVAIKAHAQSSGLLFAADEVARR